MGASARKAALLVGDDVVHRHGALPDGGGDIFPRPGLVLGVALGDTCRLKRWAMSQPHAADLCRVHRDLRAGAGDFARQGFSRRVEEVQALFVHYAQGRPDTKKLLADYSPNIDQIWIPGMNVVDRCTTCHQGITQPSLADASVPQPFRAHPPIPHNVRDWGCTVCHRGQGPATEVAEAHETTLAWEQPILPAHYPQASCGSCHQADLKETPQLTRGRELLCRIELPGLPQTEQSEPPDARPGSHQRRQQSYRASGFTNG